MKKYLVIIALLLFGKAEAQKKYPQITYRIDTTVDRYGDSMVVTRTQTKEVIDSAVSVYYHGMLVTTPTKDIKSTTTLSQHVLTISKQVSEKFDEDQAPIYQYLLHGRQTADAWHVVTMKHFPKNIKPIFYSKDNVLYYKNQVESSGKAVIFLMIYLLLVIILDCMFAEKYYKEKDGLIKALISIGALAMNVLMFFVLFDNNIHKSEEVLPGFIISTIVFSLIFSIEIVRKKIQQEKLDKQLSK